MHIAIEGCCHGELDKIYETLQYIEKKENIEISLLLCCGDFEAIRNQNDLKCMAVPDKYKEMKDFWQYYSGKKKAPYLTIFIGGNHEASNYLQELPYGGWVAPNIFYLGYAGVVNYKGIRIGGISGIFKQHDYTKGHFEKPPYSEQTKRSVYHIRQIEVFRLKQMKQPIDVMMSHDWPNGIVNYGDRESLLQRKRHFQRDVENNQLGSLPAWNLLEILRPKYWFSGHLHVKFAAKVKHPDVMETADVLNKNTMTRFLALDKCLPRREFLQVLRIDTPDDATGNLCYDAEWLAILKHTDEMMSTSYKSLLVPTPGLHKKWDYSVNDQQINQAMEVFENDLTVPLNFCPDECSIYTPENSFQNQAVYCKCNNQTKEFCAKLEINDPLMTLIESVDRRRSFNSFNTSSSFMNEEDEMPSTIISNASINPDEIDLDDDDDDDGGGGGDTGNTSSMSGAPLMNPTSSVEVGDPVMEIPISVSSVSNAEEADSGSDKNPGWTPIRIAAKFSMNLPSPLSSTPQSAPTCSSVPPLKNNLSHTDSSLDAPCSPINSSICHSSEDSSSPSLRKRNNSMESKTTECTSDATQQVKKFKRRNASLYISQNENDTS